MIAAIAGVLAIGTPIISSSVHLTTRHEASKTADAAALAAADALLGWIDAEPCLLANQISNASGFELTACMLDLTDATVSIRFGIFRTVISARAGSPL